MAKSRVQSLLLLLMPLFFSSAVTGTIFYNCSRKNPGYARYVIDDFVNFV
ncbi:predicted protein [Arabidopsis lyrata subsp. lyrata]|uniref:Predicted protein n=1 Tax=Arabidopsis lyrata subsp. lyrata TaxID=81972 RepID=D7L863_ARALL|nr:predicted protein [Arabidopsis lyrata subsp. lyrata]